jgi:hypothetical protein
MKTDIENNEWKAEAPYLASLPKQNPFCVPEQYFATLPHCIELSVYTEKLKAVAGEAGFIVPDQYFTTSKAQIIASITDEHPLALPLSSGFSTPDLYFKKLQAGIIARTAGLSTMTEQKATPYKAVPKLVRLWQSDLIKYASAACFILVTAFGLYLNQQTYTKDSTVADLANEQMLYDIDEQDIIEHIERNAPDAQQNNPTHQELETYILNNYSQNDLSSAIN